MKNIVSSDRGYYMTNILYQVKSLKQVFVVLTSIHLDDQNQTESRKIKAPPHKPFLIPFCYLSLRYRRAIIAQPRRRPSERHFALPFTPQHELQLVQLQISTTSPSRFKTKITFLKIFSNIHQLSVLDVYR